MRVAAQSAQPALHFWRPVPREAADIICGEGAIVDVPIRAHQALQLTLSPTHVEVINGRRAAVVMRPGQVYVAAPLELHGLRSVDGASCAVRMLLVSNEALQKLERRIPGLWRGTSSGHQQFLVDDPDVYAELWALIGEMRGPLVSLSCTERLLACLDRLFSTPAVQPERVTTPKSDHAPDGVGRVCQHLRAHADASVSLDELASVAGLSKFYLLRAFRRAHGVTPHAYQMQLRLALAWRYIVDGSPLTRATYEAGFADQSHLTRRFSAAFGITPARYARQLAVSPGAQSRALALEEAKHLRLATAHSAKSASSAA
ncbi:MAG: Helix-turn-helix, AraC protein [Gemmatimonadetes bacterium]|nr:Helix-turn-helix, AraC protein [Gemmatimonadota bacterium]